MAIHVKVSNLPPRWQIVHWTITIILGLVLGVIILLCGLPIWIKQDRYNWADKAVDLAESLRLHLLGNIYEKYNLFEKLKH